LDDAFSELDAKRRRQLLKFAQEFPQTFITATDAEFLHGAAATLWKVENGSVSKRASSF
jgi:recombinational DNA repair ATPase RecF